MDYPLDVSREDYEKAILLSELLTSANPEIWNYTHIRLLSKMAELKRKQNLASPTPVSLYDYPQPISMKRTFAILLEKENFAIK
jgi:hypothetical protein